MIHFCRSLDLWMDGYLSDINFGNYYRLLFFLSFFLQFVSSHRLSIGFVHNVTRETNREKKRKKKSLRKPPNERTDVKSFSAFDIIYIYSWQYTPHYAYTDTYNTGKKAFYAVCCVYHHHVNTCAWLCISTYLSIHPNIEYCYTYKIME